MTRGVMCELLQYWNHITEDCEVFISHTLVYVFMSSNFPGFTMEKTPLKLKLKLGSGGPSTPEQKKSSPVHPTIITSMAEEEQGQVGSEEEMEEEECAEDIQVRHRI